MKISALLAIGAVGFMAFLVGRWTQAPGAALSLQAQELVIVSRSGATMGKITGEENGMAIHFYDGQRPDEVRMKVWVDRTDAGLRLTRGKNTGGVILADDYMGLDFANSSGMASLHLDNASTLQQPELELIRFGEAFPSQEHDISGTRLGPGTLDAAGYNKPTVVINTSGIFVGTPSMVPLTIGARLAALSSPLAELSVDHLSNSQDRLASRVVVRNPTGSGMAILGNADLQLQDGSSRRTSADSVTLVGEDGGIRHIDR